MSLKLGLYELFGRIIPGFFYMAAFTQAGVLFGFYKLDIQALSKITLTTTFFLGVIAYILGTALNLLSILWIRLFKPKDTLETALAMFRKRNPDWKINFQASDWHVLLAFIRRQNLALADDVIEKQNALSLMLRNISLAMIFLALDQAAGFFLTGGYVYIGLALLFVVLSLLMSRESKYFQVLFYATIFETIMAYKMDLDEVLVKKQEG
jgi:hypothetical protein